MATYRAVQGEQTIESRTRRGWYVERLEPDAPDDVGEIVSPIYDTKAEAEAEARRLQKAEEDV